MDCMVVIDPVSGINTTQKSFRMEDVIQKFTDTFKLIEMQFHQVSIEECMFLVPKNSFGGENRSYLLDVVSQNNKSSI